MTEATRQAPTLEELRARRDEIIALAEQHGAYNVRVFGSVARGKAISDSDVDFLVSYRAGISLLDVVALIQDLGDLLACDVDVVDERAIKPRLREGILRDAVEL
jgi:uncharacterized protein